MKRRAFIGLLGASALSMPFILSQHGLGVAKRNGRMAAMKKVPLKVKLPRDVKEITTLLGAKSRDLYLLGGPALAAAAGVNLPYVNLLMDTTKFSELKKSLFEFGVSPISTADLPANFVRFTYRDKGFNVLNMNVDTYAQMSMAGQENGLILFAHNFLMYNVKESFMLDPYDALTARSENGKAFLIKPIQQPRTLLHGFEHCLAATFDRALLGLETTPEYNEIEQRLFQSTPTAADSKEIMSQLLDYTSDILEVGGVDAAARLLGAPVCLAAGKTAAAIDFAKVEKNLRQLESAGVRVSGREFMTSVHDELKKKPIGKGAAQGLPEYLVTTRDQFRRIEVLLDAMETRTA
jgi:hypothetical protein